ncbi:MAG: hypothetical protein AAFZ15_16240 [Bacteroidota bacterium]
MNLVKLVFISFVVMLLFNSCISNSTIFFQKNKRSHVTNSYSNDFFVNNGIPARLQGRGIGIEDCLNSPPSGNHSFFISFYDNSANTYREVRSTQVTNDSIIYERHVKENNKDSVESYYVNYRTGNIQLLTVTRNQNDHYLIFRVSSTSGQTSDFSLDTLVIRDFVAREIVKDVLHIYEGKMVNSDGSVTDFVVINDPDGEAVFKTLRVERDAKDYQQAVEDCRNILRRKCNCKEEDMVETSFQPQLFGPDFKGPNESSKRFVRCIANCTSD